MKKGIKRCFITKCVCIFLLLLLYISISALSYASEVSTHLSDSVFRLHVLANSDSEEDQNLKYKVRDAVINYMESISENVTSKEEVIALANEHLEDFRAIAKQVVLENGYDYEVSVEIGNFSFPTKNYGDISLPAGFYDSLRIKIGKAEGQNWWCVMFPPLCFVDVSSGIIPEESKEMMQANLSEEEFGLISKEDSEITFKFKILEFLGNMASTLTAKK